MHDLSLPDMDRGAYSGTGSPELCHRAVSGWTRVHDLPDYVYFDHSIHIRKGIGCESCHGAVNEMALMWQEIEDRRAALMLQREELRKMEKKEEEEKKEEG